MDSRRRVCDLVRSGEMDPTLIRQLIQQRLWDRRLPHERSVELWSGPGSGTCDGCGEPISTHQTMTMRIDAEDWAELRFHMECFAIWDDERLKRTARHHAPSPDAPRTSRF